MTKQTYVKVAGVWKPCTSIWTKAGGVWKQNVMPHVRVGGVYKECMQYDPVQDFSPIHGNEFEWDGFTYKVIVKDYGDGVKLAWLDRNLGASRVATSSNDTQAYGDLYQWGRLTDGHEKNGSSATYDTSDTDVPGHGLFIIKSGSPYDWRIPSNDNLWANGNGINNPSPPGWRVPSIAEILTERNSWTPATDAAGAFASSLKFPLAGYRHGMNGGVNNTEYAGYLQGYNYASSSRNYYLWYSPNGSNSGIYYRHFAHSIRCVRSDVD